MREWSVGQPRGAFFSGRQVTVGAEHAQRAGFAGEIVDQYTHGRFHVPLPTPPVALQKSFELSCARSAKNSRRAVGSPWKVLMIPCSPIPRR